MKIFANKEKRKQKSISTTKTIRQITQIINIRGPQKLPQTHSFEKQKCTTSC